jgi:hypothetical protein
VRGRDGVLKPAFQMQDLIDAGLNDMTHAACHDRCACDPLEITLFWKRDESRCLLVLLIIITK